MSFAHPANAWHCRTFVSGSQAPSPLKPTPLRIQSSFGTPRGSHLFSPLLRGTLPRNPEGDRAKPGRSRVSMRRLEEIIEQATVDCYDESEQSTVCGDRREPGSAVRGDGAWNPGHRRTCRPQPRRADRRSPRPRSGHARRTQRSRRGKKRGAKPERRLPSALLGKRDEGAATPLGEDRSTRTRDRGCPPAGPLHRVRRWLVVR